MSVVCGYCNGDQTGFTPTGGMADDCCLAELIANKKEESCSIVLSWIRA